MMTSQVYQQVSDEPAEPLDADNRLWNRANRRRLDFEATRDALLFVTGQLQDRIGGPSQNLLDGFQPRRTLYSFLNRQDLPGLLSVFDFPSPAATSGQRETTTISPQALFLMNGPLMGSVADAVRAANRYRLDFDVSKIEFANSTVSCFSVCQHRLNLVWRRTFWANNPRRRIGLHSSTPCW